VPSDSSPAPDSLTDHLPATAAAAEDLAVVEEAEALAAQLLGAARRDRDLGERLRSARVARLLGDEESVQFILALTDEVLRIRDPRRAARHLVELVEQSPAPRFLGRADRLALAVGTRLAPKIPRIVLPLVRERVRAEFGGVVLPLEERAFARHAARRAKQGIRLNLNVLGEAILGENEADKRFRAVLGQLDRPEVDYVSVKISSICSQINVLAFDAEVERIAERLRKLYDAAARHRPAKFVNLDMEEYRDLGLTVAVFERVLDEEAYASLSAGIVLQAYIPDSLGRMEELCSWARRRYERAGGSIKVRIVKGANLAMEQVEAELAGWPQAPFLTKAETDANYKAMLDVALEPENAGAIRVGVASHNLFEVAWALRTAQARNAADRIEIEMLEGMANATALAVRNVAGAMLLYAPVANRSDAESVIAYLVRRFDENTGPENFLRHQFDLAVGSPAWEKERLRFRAAVAARSAPRPLTRRVQDRQTEERSDSVVGELDDARFANEADTDFSIAANREWIGTHLESFGSWPLETIPAVVAGETISSPTRGVGVDPSHPGRTLYSVVNVEVSTVERAIEAAGAAARSFSHSGLRERQTMLRAVAVELEASRGRLIAAMAYEGGKTVAEADPEVSEAVDYARFYANSTGQISAREQEGLRFAPFGTVVVASPWNFPLAIAASGVLAALAAGNAVILKPAPQAVATGYLLAEACWRAGVPRELLQFLPAGDDEAGQRLISHDEVGAVILTGAFQTARMFLGWRPKLELHAETSGKNAIVVTAAADLDAAVGDLVRSAFGHAGQKCSAASLGILEASVYDDPRFCRQLADAVSSLRPGSSTELSTTMGPLITAPQGVLRDALTRLGPGERWLVEPYQIGDNPHLWSPGVKLGVRPGSSFHLTECFGPVLGLMRARDLDEAIAFQNQTDYGLTAGLHSLDPAEIAYWRERVEAGNLYVNRHTTGAIVSRQPFGGWKRSSVGPSVKAGGPNYVSSLGRFELSVAAMDKVAFLSRAKAIYDGELAHPSDVSGLRAEANVFRYRPLRSLCVRVAAGFDDDDLDVVLRTAAIVGVATEVSLASERGGLARFGVVEDDAGLVARMKTVRPARLRLLGSFDPELKLALLDAGLSVDDVAFVRHPRLELHHLLAEQAVSETRHRYGNVTTRRPGVADTP